MLSLKHRKILEEIVELSGSCLEAKRCSVCPFAAVCLPEFVKDRESRPSKTERANMAADVLVRVDLLGEEDEPQEQYSIH